MRPSPGSIGDRAATGLKRAAWIGLLGVMITGGLTVTPALSKARLPALKLSQAIGSVEKKYPDPLIGSRSNNSSGGVVVVTLYPSPDDCDQDHETTCDVIDLDLLAPKKPDSDNPYLVKVTLTWKGGTNNDLDFTFSRCTNVAARTGCTRLRYVAGGSAGTESMGITNLAGCATPEKPSCLLRYEIVVANMAGLNEGYALRVEWLEGKFVQFARPQPKASATSSPTAASRRSGIDLTSSSTEKEKKATPKPVKTPGADGPLTTTEIAALRRNALAASEGRTWFWLVLAVVVALTVASALILLRRRRLAAREKTI